MPMEERENLFEIANEGWMAQNRGRDLWELFRELMQNALDSDSSEITVRVDSRQKRIVIEDDGEGFDNIEDAWSVFGGSKGGDPSKRGRFGRGLKEFIPSTTYTKVVTTSGTVEFDVQEGVRRVDREAGREHGTKIVAENEDWKQRHVREIWEYVDKIWVPEGQSITVDVKGGRTERKEREQPKFSHEVRMQTVHLNEETGAMETTYRWCEIHVKESEGRDGRLYEMGIPVTLDEDFPYYVDVQQKIPMAEQRNEPDDSWFKYRFLPKFINALWHNGEFENLSKKRLRGDWLTQGLKRLNDDEPKEYWVDEVIADKRKEGVVTSSGVQADDTAENHGYQVFDPTKAGSSVAEIVKDVSDSSRDVAKKVSEQSQKKVDPNPEQEKVIQEFDRLAEEAGYERVTFELWSWEPAPGTAHMYAEHQGGGTVRLNQKEREWEELTGENIGTAIHEIAHEEGVGHDKTWEKAMQDIAGELLATRL